MAVFSIIAALCATAIYLTFRPTSQLSMRASAEPRPTVVIDAGHGGMDGGCVSIPITTTSTVTSQSGSGAILEKDCNLAIAKTVAALYRISGYNVVMTRETDVMLDSEGLTGNAKMRDLKARLEIARSYPDATFISIHCNKFPSSECKGLQVYYSVNDSTSAMLAENIQNSVKALLQPENRRLPKPSGSNIYILDRAKQPSVLIECGFLSNPEEAVQLSNSEYRKQLSLAIVLPLLQNTK